MEREEMKRIAGRYAADLVQPNQNIGIGTGTTIFYFIERLIERVQDGLSINAAYTSLRSKEQAEAGGITSLSEETLTTLDITFDGADEINNTKQMIKGGGGALTREKIIASSSSQMIVVVDEDKCVAQLGAFPLPIEILPFCAHATTHKIEALGYIGMFRHDENHDLYVTDNGNYIYDAKCEFIPSPEKLHQQLINIPGVVETGLFFNLAKRLVVGCKDGNVRDL